MTYVLSYLGRCDVPELFLLFDCSTTRLRFFSSPSSIVNSPYSFLFTHSVRRVAHSRTTYLHRDLSKPFYFLSLF